MICVLMEELLLRLPKEEIVEQYKENGWEWDFCYCDDEDKECL